MNIERWNSIFHKLSYLRSAEARRSGDRALGQYLLHLLKISAVPMLHEKETQHGMQYPCKSIPWARRGRNFKTLGLVLEKHALVKTVERSKN